MEPLAAYAIASIDHDENARAFGVEFRQLRPVFIEIALKDAHEGWVSPASEKI